MKNLWIIPLLFLALCTGCSKDATVEEQPTSEIVVSGFDPESIIPLEGGDFDVTVTSTTTWRLTGKKTWCHPSVVEGKSGEKVTFTVDPNPTGDSRSIIYKFFCGAKTIPITVTQAPAKLFSIESEPVFEIATAGGNAIVKVTSNIDYTFKVEDDGKAWITAPETRSVTTDRVTFRVQANPNYVPRTGHITFTANGKDYSIEVNQKQLDKLTLEKTAYDMVAEGGKIEVNISTNVAYSVAIEAAAAGWIHRTTVPSAQGATGVVDCTETFTIDSSKAPRSGKITFKSPDGALSVDVQISQEGPSVSYAEFPDATFAGWLKNSLQGYIIDAKDAPGKYEVTEKGLALTKLTLSAHAIATIKGIEAFTNLTLLEGVSCRIAHYELGSSKVEEIYIPRLGSVINVKVSGGNVKNVNFSNSSKLETLDVSESPKMNVINVNYCPNMKTIYLKQGQVVGSIQKPESCTIVYK